jgi:hypothetical protein
MHLPNVNERGKTIPEPPPLYQAIVGEWTAALHSGYSIGVFGDKGDLIEADAFFTGQ